MSRGRSAEHLALGEAIRERRDAVGLSQERVAELSDVHRNYFGGIERGERNPSYANLLKVAAALEIPLSELIARAEALAPRRRRRAQR